MVRILMVDDEINILEGYRRQYQKIFDLHLAQSSEEGLKAITEKGPFSVVVSDCKMPCMDGVEFLRQVREIAPDTLRIMLTGFADVHIARQAVTEGSIFRFLNKPCQPGLFKMAIDAGIAQVARRHAMRVQNPV